MTIYHVEACDFYAFTWQTIYIVTIIWKSATTFRNSWILLDIIQKRDYVLQKRHYGHKQTSFILTYNELWHILTDPDKNTKNWSGESPQCNDLKTKNPRG